MQHEKNEASKVLLQDEKRIVYPFFILSCVIIFTVHAVKGLGMPPTIWPDEQEYSYMIRLIPISEAHIPNYLYYAVYRVCTIFGDRFLDAARVLNAFFFVLSAPAIYKIARIACGRWLSAFIAILSLLLPISILTLLLMVESVYYTGFWVFAWFVLKRRGEYRVIDGLYFGCGLAVLSFVKVHGVFLLCALSLFFILLELGNRRKGSIKYLFSIIGLMLAAYFAIRLSIGYCVAGNNGLHILGTFYSNLADKETQVFSVSHFIARELNGFLGNALGLCLVGGIPICLLFSALRPNENDESRRFYRLSVFAVSFFATLVLLSTTFTALIETSPEKIRLQTRFYSFLFPLFLLLPGYAYSLHQKGINIFNRTRSWHIVPVIILALIAFATTLSSYTVDFMPHAPEFAGMFKYNILPDVLNTDYLLTFLMLFSCCLWLYDRSKSLLFFLAVFMPIYVCSFLFNYQLNFIRDFSKPDAMQIASENVQRYLGDDCAYVTIMAPSRATGGNIAYFLDNKNVKIVIFPKSDGVPYLDVQQIAPHHKWVIASGNFEIPKGTNWYFFDFVPDVKLKRVMSLFLFRVADFSFSVDLTKPTREWPLSDLTRKPTELVLSYEVPLPSSMRISLELDADYSGGEPLFEVFTSAGGEKYTFKASVGNLQEYTVRCRLPTNEIYIRTAGVDVGQTKSLAKIHIAPAP